MVKPLALFTDKDGCNRKDKEQDREPNSDVEEGLFYAAPGREYAASILTGQATQPNALVLQDHANDEGD